MLNRTALLILAMMMLSGCTGFERDWRTELANPRLAAAGPAGAPADHGITGLWEGTWQSQANGHNGRLRAIVSYVGDNIYRARYHAVYAKVLTFEYEMTFQGVPRDGLVHFTGAADLGGLAGGVYSYEGRADAANFYSVYRSKHDFGTYTMSRPPPSVATP